VWQSANTDGVIQQKNFKSSPLSIVSLPAWNSIADTIAFCVYFNKYFQRKRALDEEEKEILLMIQVSKQE